MRITIAGAAFDRFPGVTIVALRVAGADNRTPCPAVEAGWRAAWRAASEAGSASPNPQSHPRVRPWRERFQAMGVSPKQFPSSIEALLRRAMKGGEPFTVNPLVDFYNTVSLRHTVPAGGFDLAGIPGDVELRLTCDGDTFLALDATEPEPVPPGEVAYTAGSTVLTRHFVWRQSRVGLLDAETTNLLLVSEVLGEVGRDVAVEVLGDLVVGIREHFGVRPEQMDGVLLSADPSVRGWSVAADF